MRHLYSIERAKLIDFCNIVDVEAIAEMRCNIYSNKSIETAIEMILNDLPLSSMPIAYRESGKLVLVRTSDMLEHMLAIYNNEKMGLCESRINIPLVPDTGLTHKPRELQGTMNVINLARQYAAIPNVDAEAVGMALEVALDVYGSYEVPMIVYDQKEKAITAANLA